MSIIGPDNDRRPISTTQGVTSPSTKPAEATSSSPKKSATTDKYQSVHTIKDHIASWSTKAGILTGANLTIHNDLNKRALFRKSVEARRRQANIERIITLAQDYTLADNVGNPIDPDWFYHFVEMAEDINNATMQKLWSQILVRETALPGSFSLKSLGILKGLTHKDAKLLERIAQFSGHSATGKANKVIFGLNARLPWWSVLRSNRYKLLNLAEYGLSYPQILSLMEIGILYNTEIESQMFVEETLWQVADKTLRLTPKGQGGTVTYYKFTYCGNELLALLKPSVNEDYYAALRALFSPYFSLEGN